MAESRTLEEAAGYVTATLNLAGAPTPERIRAAQISSCFFQTMGIEPYLGRTLQEADLEPKPVPVVITSLMGFFAVAALILAALGVYSVMSYLVGLRTREIGVQMALGASRSHVSRRVMVRALKLVAAGVGLGLVAALEATKLLRGLLFWLTSVDPATYVTVVLILLAVAPAAAYFPARRAASLDPIVALRYE